MYRLAKKYFFNDFGVYDGSAHSLPGISVRSLSGIMLSSYFAFSHAENRASCRVASICLARGTAP